MSTPRFGAPSDTETPCYVAKCRCGCGSLVFASVDAPQQSAEFRNDTAEEIATLIRDGYVIERMSVGDVRTSMFMCKTRIATSKSQQKRFEAMGRKT